MKPFHEADTPGDEAFTYQGDEVRNMDIGWVTDLDYFDDVHDPIVLTRKKWMLVDVDTVTIYPPQMLCTRCNGDEYVLVVNGPSDAHEEVCPRCNATGTDPLAGEVVPGDAV